MDNRFKKLKTVLILLALILTSSFASAEKQTVFNDKNYEPKEIANIIQSQPIKNSNSKVKIKTQKPQARTVTRDWHKVVKKGYKPIVERGQFSYTIQNSVISTNETCNNYAHGSLMYRSCRVAAKEQFRKWCRNGYKPACPAKNMRP